MPLVGTGPTVVSVVSSNRLDRSSPMASSRPNWRRSLASSRLDGSGTEAGSWPNGSGTMAGGRLDRSGAMAGTALHRHDRSSWIGLGTGRSTSRLRLPSRKSDRRGRRDRASSHYSSIRDGNK